MLNTTHRGTIEQLIDEAIKNMPATVEYVRHHGYSEVLKDKDGNDFVLGYVIGRIDTTFKAEILSNQDRDFTIQELREIDDIIHNRVSGLKEAIFKCG